MITCKLKDNSEKNKLLWKILENIKTEIEKCYLKTEYGMENSWITEETEIRMGKFETICDDNNIFCIMEMKRKKLFGITVKRNYKKIFWLDNQINGRCFCVNDGIILDIIRKEIENNKKYFSDLEINVNLIIV